MPRTTRVYSIPSTVSAGQLHLTESTASDTLHPHRVETFPDELPFPFRLAHQSLNCVSQCRLSMVILFVIPMILVISAVSLPVWYLAYLAQMERISDLSTEVRKRMILDTGNRVVDIFSFAESDMGRILSIVQLNSSQNQLCANWTSKVFEKLPERILAPIFSLFSSLGIARAVSVNGNFESINEVFLMRYNTSDVLHLTRIDIDTVETHFVKIGEISKISSGLSQKFSYVSLVGRYVDGQFAALTNAEFSTLRTDSEPSWESVPTLLFGVPVYSIHVILPCLTTTLTASNTLLRLSGSVAISNFSALLAENVEGLQRMFITFQSPDGPLLATSHGTLWAHAESATSSSLSDLFFVDGPVRLLAPQECDDEIIRAVAFKLFLDSATWDLRNMDTSIPALGQDWLVLSGSLIGPGLELQLWLLQDTESLYGDLRASLRHSVTVFFIALGASLVVGIAAAFFMTRPLTRLSNSMDTITVDRFRFQDMAGEEWPLSWVREVCDLQLRCRWMLEILDCFAHYVPEMIIHQTVSNHIPPKLIMTRQHITVLFLDIVDFNSTMNSLTEEQILFLLNGVHKQTTRNILKHRGTVDKYIGDCVMALWGAPMFLKFGELHACRAVSQCMYDAERCLCNSLRRQRLPLVRFYAGIHSGPAVVGNIGSEHRYSFTAIGDTVNATSRLEAANRVYGTYSIVSESVAEIARKEFAFALLGGIKLIGRTEEMKIYELLINDSEDEEKLQNTMVQWDTAMKLYVGREFLKAQIIFDELTQRVRASAHFADRCRLFQIQEPDADWDGSELQRHK